MQKRTNTECEAVTNGGTEQCETATIRGDTNFSSVIKVMTDALKIKQKTVETYLVFYPPARN